MSLQTFSKGALRVAKNYTKGYSHTQMKVREATCNDPWPPSGKQMYELAQMTYNPDDFVDIMEILDKRLNDKGKNWRHVFKSLTVLDYLLHTGSENVIIYSRDNLYIIKTLREFQYIDDEGRDEGANVRQKAKDISNLLMDDSRLREERRVRARMRERLSGRGRIYDMDDESDDYSPAPYHPPRIQSVRPRTDGNDDELRRAIEESKRSLAHERANAEERDMQRAIKLSEEEEEKRKKALLEANATALFDERNQLPAPTGQTNPFPLVDASLPLQYAVTGVQPQYTAVQPQYTALQPQFTSYNPYQQQALQEAMQVRLLSICVSRRSGHNLNSRQRLRSRHSRKNCYASSSSHSSNSSSRWSPSPPLLSGPHRNAFYVLFPILMPYLQIKQSLRLLLPRSLRLHLLRAHSPLAPLRLIWKARMPTDKMPRARLQDPCRSKARAADKDGPGECAACEPLCESHGRWHRHVWQYWRTPVCDFFFDRTYASMVNFIFCDPGLVIHLPVVSLLNARDHRATILLPSRVRIQASVPSSMCRIRNRVSFVV
ncbi:Epsin-1 [Grifola frondosa]|uniref:Epsin-1 n=1 Tax=Grifola frondosa TaxID=5627 RepID=A0A1C7LKC3_GRIFR|nr:Epsin-1 [Grifola frondosa]